MSDSTPPFLVSVKDGYVYPYSEALAAQPGLEPLFELAPAPAPAPAPAVKPRAPRTAKAIETPAPPPAAE